jgi:hypothetical protein
MNEQEDDLSTAQQEVGLSAENEYIETQKENGRFQQWRPSAMAYLCDGVLPETVRNCQISCDLYAKPIP